MASWEMSKYSVTVVRNCFTSMAKFSFPLFITEARIAFFTGPAILTLWIAHGWNSNMHVLPRLEYCSLPHVCYSLVLPSLDHTGRCKEQCRFHHVDIQVSTVLWSYKEELNHDCDILHIWHDLTSLCNVLTIAILSSCQSYLGFKKHVWPAMDMFLCGIFKSELFLTLPHTLMHRLYAIIVITPRNSVPSYSVVWWPCIFPKVWNMMRKQMKYLYKTDWKSSDSSNAILHHCSKTETGLI